MLHLIIAVLILAVVIGCIGGLICLINHGYDADWKGALRRRFRLTRMRYEWGRVCYVVDCCGETRASWWEWEKH